GLDQIDLIETNVRLLGSWIHGTPEAMDDTMRKIRHLYQRPDQSYLHLDPGARSLAGAGALIEAGRFQGPGWHYGTGIDTRSPGFERNDAGFQKLGDYYLQWGFVEYLHDQPSEHLLSWRAALNSWVFADYQPLLGEQGNNLFGTITLPSHWDIWSSASVAGH